MTRFDLGFLQAHLDEIKYFRSQEAECDLSGKMDYCLRCPYKVWNEDKKDWVCTATQEDRKEGFLCALGYLRIEMESGNLSKEDYVTLLRFVK